VKTRLVPPLSFRQAAALAEAFLLDLCAKLGRLPDVRTTLLVSPPNAPRLQQLLPDLPRRPQSDGDLGRRLTAAMDEAHAEADGAVMVVGSDHPTLPLDWISSSLRTAQGGSLGWIPTEDGGFAALAANRSWPGLFDGVPWSTPGVAAAVRTNAARLGCPLVESGVWYDVDERADLDRLVRDLVDDPSCPATRRVLKSLAGTLARSTGSAAKGVDDP
jgi:glycosyltransferase A (GT-A) superfamily protein (DUF2064 family)